MIRIEVLIFMCETFLLAYYLKQITDIPFFDGLIPEGWLLDIVTHNWKISQSDRFGVLLVACKDPIGNVSVRSEKL